MGGLSRDMGQDGKTPTEASTTIIYYCQEHGINACPEAKEIGWVTTAVVNTRKIEG